jgi:hypothetical protein
MINSLAFLPFGLTAMAQTPCEGLKALSLSNATITAAEVQDRVRLIS